jgi:hypothetical protein
MVTSWGIRRACGAAGYVGQGDASREDTADQPLCAWALQASNLRPPPCKGARGGRESAGHSVESRSDQHRRLSLVVVDLYRFSAFHGLETDLGQRFLPQVGPSIDSLFRTIHAL